MKSKAITLSMKESERYDIIQELIRGEINGTEAGKKLNLSTRQIRRIKVKVDAKGMQGLAHGNRGRPSNRKLSEQKINKMKKIVEEKYVDFKPSFAAEKLNKKHKITIGREKLRLLMIDWRLWQPKPRKENKQFRKWRERKENFGEMVQFDGSYHDWLENGKKLCLLAGIDDATSQMLEAIFDKSEGVKPVFNYWKKYLLKLGKPAAIYVDRHSTYHQNQKSVLGDPRHWTQFNRAMNDLGIKLITAHSPQAKGRIERLFGTLQDRLVKEMRLEKIKTVDKANQYLEKYPTKHNAQFSVVAHGKKNFHRKLSQRELNNLDRIFSLQNYRRVNNDFTIKYKNRWFQLLEAQPTLVLRKDKVLIEERLDSTLYVSLREKYLDFTELPERPERIAKIKAIALSKEKTNWKSPVNHPWRQFLINQQIAKKGVKVKT